MPVHISLLFVVISRMLTHLQDSIVKIALKIWIGTRMAQEFFCVVEENDFNIHVVQDPNSIHHGQCPLPPVLDHQLDVLMIIEMMKMTTVILKKLKKIINTRSRSNWFEAYLTIFILLSNLQYVYHSQERWWKMHYNTVCNCETHWYDRKLTFF